MTEREALKKMVPPSQHRPGAYMQGIIQIWVTRTCDKCCYGCTQGSNLKPRRGDYISLDQFAQACLSLKDYFGVVGVFGGNPAMHPQFEALCDILTRHIPFHRRGLWCNNPLGKGAAMRRTFNPMVSNLNVHQDKAAFEEFKQDWPECNPIGLNHDSRHAPPWVALKDVIEDEGRRWALISDCDINQHWSAMIGVFRGQLRAWFCEVAGAQSMLHQDEADYPDTGKALVDDSGDWWKQPMRFFEGQVRKHCHECGIPLKAKGELANAVDGTEQVSETHQSIFHGKPGHSHRIELVTTEEQLKDRVGRVTNYLLNATK